MSSLALDVEPAKAQPTVTISNQKTYNPGHVYASVLYCVLGSLFFGYVMSAFNPISEFVEYHAFDSKVSGIQINFMTSFVPLGAAAGALSGAKFCSKIGRRKSMILLDILGIIGTVLTILPTPIALILGRLLQGYCVGANSSVTPLYINEVSPSEITGSTGTYNQLLISTGVLLAPVLGLGMPAGKGDSDPNNGFYRIILLVAGIPCIVRLILTFTIFRQDTPKFLVSMNREEEAVSRLKKIYKESRVQSELDELKKEIAEKSQKGKMTLADAFKQKYRRRVIIGILIAVFQQLSGINAIIFFSNKIFSQGVPDGSNRPTIYTIIMDVIQVLTNLVSGVIVERLGRRLLLFSGFAVTTIILAAFGILGIAMTDSPALKFFIWGYMVAFGLSLGPLPWVYISDILPDVALGVAVLSNWVTVFAIGIAFPPIADGVGTPQTFLFFAVCCVIATLFVFALCRETKGKTEAEITVMFAGKKYAVQPTVDAKGKEVDFEQGLPSKATGIDAESTPEILG